MSKFEAVIFDLGGVLVDWNPDYLYKPIFNDDERMNDFYARICTPDWNEQQDEGRTLKEATEELVARFPHEEENIRLYYDRWEDMLKGPVDGTVEILRKLKKKGDLKLYALTNWSAETFPVALNRFDFLHWFDGRLVSGEEKMRKPFRPIYDTIIKKFNINPGTAIYIDDNARN
ncbi:MAG TPA: HAD hydrolase-like protein, partial [Flavitalea sp.]|nr:HAD hydrolase-like protein [Flavitalea sp.]